MGFIKKAMKGVSKDDIKSAESGGGYRGLDAGGYVAEVIDVKMGEYGPNSNNAGRHRLELELKVKENWDGEKVDPEQKLFASIGLFSHWKSGKLNFTFFQFLKSLEDGWDYEEDEPLFDIDDEDDARESLLGLRLNVQVGYRVTEPSEKYPTPNVFNEVSRFLQPDADLGPDTRLGDYDSYKEKALSKTTVAPARGAARRDTDTKFSLG